MYRFLLMAAFLGLFCVNGIVAEDKGKPKGDRKSKDGKDSKDGKKGGGDLFKMSAEEYIKKYDKNNDGVLTKDEVNERMEKGFDKVDTNGDGKLDKEEITKFQEEMKKRMGKDKGDKGDKPGDKGDKGDKKPEVEKMVAKILEDMDGDKDGKISKEEAKGPMKEHFDRIDANKDGFLDKEELEKAAAHFLAGGGGKDKGRDKGRDKSDRPDRKTNDFDALDKDADGRLTKDELKGTPFEKDFDDIDTNEDGKIDRKEFESHLKKLADKKN